MYYFLLLLLSFIVFSTARKLDTIEEAFVLERERGRETLGFGLFVKLVFVSLVSLWNHEYVCLCLCMR